MECEENGMCRNWNMQEMECIEMEFARYASARPNKCAGICKTK